MFTLTFDTDNAAFNQFPGIEIARILRDIAVNMHRRPSDGISGIVVDKNGNTIGSYDLSNVIAP